MVHRATMGRRGVRQVIDDGDTTSDIATSHTIEATARTLAPMLLDEMRSQARLERRRVRAGETLQTTALVHEAYIRLQRSDAWQGGTHFLRAAAMAMRQALVDHARHKLAAKRGSGKIESLELQTSEPFWISDERLVELDEALETLATLNPRLTHVIECRFFGGYSEAETARLLDINERTVRRDWIKAKAWLYQVLGDAPEVGKGA
jgi:RNA polymerase sigma factor (TIGR02999 family)